MSVELKYIKSITDHEEQSNGPYKGTFGIGKSAKSCDNKAFDDVEAGKIDLSEYNCKNESNSEIRLNENEDFNCCQKNALNIQTSVYSFLGRHKRVIFITIKTALLLAYLAYVAYSMYYKFGGEPEWRLLGCTIFGLLMMLGFWISKKYNTTIENWKHNSFSPFCARPTTKSVKFHLSWMLQVAVSIFITVYIIVVIALDHPSNLIPAGGVVLYILIFYITSINPAKVNWHPVFWGIALQFIFALITLETKWGHDAFQWIGDRVTEFLTYSDEGAIFVFNSVFEEHLFAFKVMPIVIFMSTVISILYYVGVIPFLVQHAGRFLGFCMGTRPAESLSAAGNIFLGMTDLPLMLRPFLDDLTNSELHAIMTGGFATIAGSVLGAYISFGVPANHLLTASVMSAPAALAMSKLTYPELDTSKASSKGYYKIEKSNDRNIFEAATNGAIVSAKLVAAIVVNVIAFLSLLKFVNVTLDWFGQRAGVDGMSLEFISSYVFYPIAYFMGADVPDCRKVATLVAKKTFTNEYIAYKDLSVMIHNRKTLNNFIMATNGTGSWWWQNDNIVYNTGTSNITLLLGIISDRSEVVSTYALCGFANFGSMGILLGALAALAPSRKADVTNMILRAMIAGNAACFMTGSIAGLLYKG